MARPVTPAQARPAQPIEPDDQSEHAERKLGRGVAIALPAATVVGALAVALFSSLGPAILILASGTLLGTIALFWASLRTLSGDAPLPEDMAAVAARRQGVDMVAER